MKTINMHSWTDRLDLVEHLAEESGNPEFLRCIKSRRVVLITDETIQKTEEVLCGQPIENFCFKNLPFSDFSVIFDSAKAGYFFAAICEFIEKDKLVFCLEFSTMKMKVFLLDYKDNVFRKLDDTYSEAIDEEMPRLFYFLNKMTTEKTLQNKPVLTKEKNLSCNNKWSCVYKIKDIKPCVHGRKAEAKNTGKKLKYHERRGHYRTLSSGKRVWVRPCHSGSISAGIITKTYKLN